MVNDYDEAIAFYTNKLNFKLLEDTPLSDFSSVSGVKRWVVVSPAGNNATRLLLAKAEGERQLSNVGHQTGGRVFLFLSTDNFWRDYNDYKSRGVEFVRGEPRKEVYGTVAVFRDLNGNLWDLIQPLDE